jgi:hypothetical protein
VGSVLSNLTKRESGDRTYPIWLIINPKHPGVRHSIWRPVLDEIQDKVYRGIQTRIDTTNIYIRSALSDCGIVPNTLNWWEREVAAEIELLKEIVGEHKPKILISFGAFPFEFVRRVFEIKPQKGPKFWANSMLVDEFENSMENFDINKINRVPILRRVIVGKNCLEHNNLSQNDIERYFQYVGTKIAQKIIENKDSLNVWI